MKKNQVLLALVCVLASISSSLRAQNFYIGGNAPNNTTDLVGTNNNYVNTYVGYTSTASNNTLVVGANTGTTLTNSSNTYIGYNGSKNTMVISNSGVVANGSFGYIGFGNNNGSSNNLVLITGSNSLWNNSTNLYIGYGVGGSSPSNTMVISNGGSVVDATGEIGYYGTASNGLVMVTGSHSLWSNTSLLYLGDNGARNQLIVSNGGKVYAPTLEVGNNVTSSNNIVTVTGSNSILTNTSLYLGGSGSGNIMVISNGGLVSDANGYVGAPGTNNFVLVTGTNSIWTNSGGLVIGRNGSGNNTMVISNGGTVADGASGYGGFIGNTPSFVGSSSSNNSVLVTGNNSIWINNSSYYGLNIGYNGPSNSMVISNGGTVTSQNGFIGYNATNASNNSVLVTGTHSIWNNGGYALSVGYGGAGNSMTISNGGTVTNSIGYIGSNMTSSNNSVLVTGSGSAWDNATNLYVGYSGSFNSMVISNQAAVSNGAGCIGYDLGSSSNFVLVTGANSTWNNNGALYIGEFQSSGNSLVISNGAQVQNQDAHLGAYSSNSTSNSVIVTGSGSIWTNTSSLYVGDNGSGNSLLVSTGGHVRNTDGWIGYGENATSNTVTITGSNATWNNSGNLTIGNNGSSNTLIISAGGQVTASNSDVGVSSSALNNSVLVTDSTSGWSSQNLVIGDSGNSSALTVSNGGIVGTIQSAVVGSSASSTGNTVLVTGAGSLFESRGSMTLGLSGMSTVTLSDGGVLEASNIVMGSNVGSVSILNIGHFGGNDSASTNPIVATSIIFGSGTSTVNFNQTDTATLTNQFVGGTNATLSQNNTGRTILAASNSFNGQIIIRNGTLESANNNALGNSNNSLLIANGSTLVIDEGIANTIGAVTLSNSVVLNGQLNATSFLLEGASNQITTVLGGTGGLTNAGGTNLLTGGNSYTGGTFLNAGMLIASNTSALGSATGTTRMTNGAVLDLGGFTQTQATVTLNGGTIQDGSLTNTAIIGASESNTVSVGVVGGSSILSARGAIIYLTSSSNNYTGGNVIDSGILVVTNGGTLGSVTGTTIITNGGALDLGGTTQQQSSVMMSGCLMTDGNISNTEVLFTAGTNTVDANIVGTSSLASIGGINIVSGTNNTYTGGTFIISSEIIVASGSQLGVSTNSLLMSNAVLDLSIGTKAQGTVLLYGATIQNGTLNASVIRLLDGTNTLLANLGDNGSPSSLVSISGTTILSGNNTYSGETLINGGTVVANSATALGNSEAVLNGGGLIINVDTIVNSMYWATNSSVITIATPGTSVLNVLGPLTTANEVNYFRPGTIDNNTNLIMTSIETNTTLNRLAILGVPTATVINIPVGGTNQYYYHIGTNSDYVVHGTQTISSNTTVANLSYDPNVTLNIESSGTLNVSSNYTSADSGTLQYVFTTTSAPALITVGGTASFTGTFTALFANGKPNYGDQYRYMVVGTNIGSFSQINVCDGTNPVADPLLRGRIICQGDPVLLLLVAPTSYTQVAQNQNQINVARALNSFIPEASGDERLVSTSLDYLTAAQYPNAFNQISPALYTSMATMAFNSAVAQYNEMVQRLGNIRVVGIGFSSMGISESPIMDDNKNPHSSGKDLLIPSVDNHWGVFVDGNGIFANVDIHNQLPGYSAEGGGVTFGADYKWNETFSTGLYAGYEGFQSKQSGGNFICDNGSRFGAFATYQHGGLFANGILGGDSHSYQVNRSIQFPGMSRTASSSPTAGELDSMLAGGCDVKRGNFTFGPITSFQYTYFGLQPFTESGAQSLDLSLATASANSLVYSLGSHCFYTWQLDKNILVVPQINLGWQHEFLQNPYALNATFENGASFAYDSTTPLRDSLYTGIGFTVNLDKKYDASFFYNASACNPSIMSQNFFVSLGTRF